MNVSRLTKGPAQGVLNPVNLKDEAMITVYWGGIKQLPRLLQLVARAYSWDEHWLKHNPPNPAGDSQNWQRVKAATSHDINQLIGEYLDPADNRGVFRKLGKRRYYKYLSITERRWFKDMATACNTAVPTIMNDIERRFLIRFLETTLDRLHNPDNDRGELSIRIVLPTLDGAYLNPDDNGEVMDEETVVRIMYQRFKLFRKHLCLKFWIVEVHDPNGGNGADDAQAWATCGCEYAEYAEYLDPNSGIVEELNEEDFKVGHAVILPVTLTAMRIV